MPVASAVAAFSATIVLTITNATAAAAQPVEQTLRLGTNGSVEEGTVVLYTCANPGQVCGPATAPPGRWTQTVAAPDGTMVYLNVRYDRAPDPAAQYGDLTDPAASPDCFISDAAGNVLVTGRGTCIYQGAGPPRPAAPPSN